LNNVESSESYKITSAISRPWSLALIMASATPAVDVPGRSTSLPEVLECGDSASDAAGPKMADAVIEAPPGFEHSVDHLFLLLYDAKAPSGRKNKAFKGLGQYAEWPTRWIKAGFLLICSEVLL
jgi:hypothetical protein